jgi:ribosomal protein S12 methylthiotransferase accessory factor YcaO
MESGLVRKDAPVEETIDRVHSLLETLGFPRERAMVGRWAAGADCHSCHLRFANYPLIFANGKGVSPELAYASALAEFIERLQCRADALFTLAGHIHRLPPFAPRVGREAAQVTAAAPGVMGHDLADIAPALPEMLACLPFVDVGGKSLVDLPVDFLQAMTGTSGMCAGNTPEEAIAHGICEVFERHVIHAVDGAHVPGLPTLPLDSLPVASPIVRRQLEALQATGVEVAVKDATLGGVFPVLAVVLTDPAAGMCHVSFGSDPVFDVALSRCVTEALQGANGLFRPILSERSARPLDTCNNLEVLLDRLEPSVGAPRASEAFTHVADNGAALRVVLDRVRQLGVGLYVRDCSLFGFPSYYVYAECLSALDRLTGEHVRHLYAHVDTMRAVLFRLPRATRDEVAMCSRVLYDEITRCSPMLEKGFTAGVLQAPVAGCLALRPLLVLMLLESGRADEARVMMGWRPTSSSAVAAAESLAAVAAWLPAYERTREGPLDGRSLRAAFAKAFGSEPPAPDGQDLHPSLPVPRCASVYACPSCPCRRYCRLDEWYRLARRLRVHAVDVQQEDLLLRLT